MFITRREGVIEFGPMMIAWRGWKVRVYGISSYAMLIAIVAMAVVGAVIDHSNVDRAACIHPTVMPATWFGACR